MNDISNNKQPLVQARVIAEHKELYRIKTDFGEYDARVTGKQIHQASSREDFPAVGDFVMAEISDNDQAVIRDILPRKNAIRKRQGNERHIVAANIDVAFIVESVNRDFNLNRLERYCAICLEQNIEPVIVLSKIDLISKDELDEKTAKIKERQKSLLVVPVSTLLPNGLDGLINIIKKDKTYCFLGSSGVGKSSMINVIIGSNAMETKEISSHSERGKHTTTFRQLFCLENGGFLIDNPGMREVGLADFETGIERVFEDFATLANQCKFSDCQHLNEPGCAILKALSEKRLNSEQYENYLKLKKEADFFELSDFERRDKERKFGKFVKNSLKKMDKRK